jgi:hypothetical protein
MRAAKLIILTVLLVLAAAAAGAEPVAKDLTGPGFQAQSDFWTPERIAEALANPKDASRQGAPAGVGASQAPEPSGQVRVSPGYRPPGAEISTPPAAPGEFGAAAACPVSPFNWDYDSDNQAYPQRVMGKVLFVDQNGQVSSCSATLVDSRIVLTAGHCMAGEGSWYHHFSWVFSPGHKEKEDPFGSARAVLATTDSRWLYAGDISYDVGFLVLDRAVGEELGWIGLLTGEQRHQSAWVQYGYPVEEPFNGELLVRSAAGWGTDDLSTTAPFTIGTGSAHRQGSSGGSWVLWSEGMPYANGVNSYYYTECVDNMYSPYFGEAVWEIFQLAKDSQ